MATMADLPHFAHPFGRGANGSVNVVEQDTEEHVMACVNVIARCPRGYRLDRPDFGWPFPEFRTAPLNVRDLEEALNLFEPRSTSTGEELADLADSSVRS